VINSVSKRGMPVPSHDGLSGVRPQPQPFDGIHLGTDILKNVRASSSHPRYRLDFSFPLGSSPGL
jgi:hypothetical protein